MSLFQVYYTLEVSGEDNTPTYRAVQRITYDTFKDMRLDIYLLESADFHPVSIRMIDYTERAPDYYEDNYMEAPGTEDNVEGTRSTA